MAELFDKYERALRGESTASSKVDSVHIAGSGVVAGGKYNRISISGSGKVTGNIEAEEIRVSGSARFMGDVTAQFFKCAGSCKIEGNVKSDLFKSAGSISISGSIEGNEVKIAGALKSYGIKARILHVSGSFKAESVEAEEAFFEISEEAVAEKIVAKRITVRPSRGENMLSLGKILKYALRRHALPVLEASEISADSVTVEDVIIKGNIVAKEIVLRGKADIVGSIQGEVKKEK
jgi:cytoskeletal protein CcmA (bactofilin family)